MDDARSIATGLVSISIALLGLGLVAGGALIIAAGSALIGALMALLGLAILAAALFFNLVPIVSDKYQPPPRHGGANGGDDADERE